MKKIFFIVILISQSTSCSRPTTIREFDPGFHFPKEGLTRKAAWFQCSKDSDCAVVDDMNCTFASVNKEHVQEFQLWARNNMKQKYAGKNCKSKDTKNTNYIPLCDTGTCSSKPK